MAKRKGLLIAFLGRFSNPLVVILLFAAAVSAFTGDIPSFVIIEVIVLMSVILDVNTHWRSLSRRKASRATFSFAPLPAEVMAALAS